MSVASERLEEPVAPLQSLAEVKSPIHNFLSSFSWAAGFLLSLMALQTGALAVVRKSSEEEARAFGSDTELPSLVTANSAAGARVDRRGLPRRPGACGCPAPVAASREEAVGGHVP